MFSKICKQLNKNTIIFDLDGTLVDAQKSMYKSICYAFKAFYGEDIPFSRKKIKGFVGKPFGKSLEQCGFSAQEIAELDRLYIEGKNMFSHYDTVMPGVYDLLEGLRRQGKVLCIATTKRSRFANEVMERFWLKKYFEHIICIDDGDFSSKQDIILHMVEKLGLRSEDCILIGNMSADMQGAVSQNINFVHSFANYGDILLISAKKFISNYDSFIRNIFTSGKKYKLDGFT